MGGAFNGLVIAGGVALDVVTLAESVSMMANARGESSLARDSW